VLPAGRPPENDEAGKHEDVSAGLATRWRRYGR
jgi:hypothetical protein